MTARELLEITYINSKWDIRMSPKQVVELVDAARKYAEEFEYIVGLK